MVFSLLHRKRKIMFFFRCVSYLHLVVDYLSFSVTLSCFNNEHKEIIIDICHQLLQLFNLQDDKQTEMTIDENILQFLDSLISCEQEGLSSLGFVRCLLVAECRNFFFIFIYFFFEIF